VMCPITGQMEGVYEESAKFITGMSCIPLEETAMTAAFLFKKVYCSMERSKASSGVTWLSVESKAAG